MSSRNQTRESAIASHLETSAKIKLELSKQSSLIAEASQHLITCSKSGGTIFTCGNGGSTTDAIHFVEELVARFYRVRPGIRAQHLCDAATITCWSNDENFESVFARQVETLVTPRDVLIGFTTSGNSKNVLLAFEAAKKIGAKTIALTGKSGGKAKSIADLSIVVPSDTTHFIQESHIALVHIFCEELEQSLYPEAVLPK